MSDRSEKVLLCVTCVKPYSQIDLEAGMLNPSSGVCIKCYDDMFEDPRSCFGKRYDPTVPDCRRLCPDRETCQLYTTGEIKVTTRLTVEARKDLLKHLKLSKMQRYKERREAETNPFMRGSVAFQVFALCLKGTTLEDIKDHCLDIGANPREVIRKIRKGFVVRQGKTYEWTTEEKHGGILIRL